MACSIHLLKIILIFKGTIMLLLSLRLKLMKCFFWLLLIPIASLQASAGPSEYELKAAFLYNLGNFITWPPNAYATEDAPFLICVLGADPFGEALNSVTNRQKIAGRPIQVTRLTNEAETKDCQLVFISAAESARTPKALNVLKNYPVVTVGDSEDFIEQGGMIMFMTVDSKIKLAISPDRLTALQLKASAKLLQIAKIIK
jgi:hypothetical protein